MGSAVSTKELKRRDLILNGNIWRVVFVIAFPLFLYQVFNYFYAIIDTIMCANISTAAVNAVGQLTQVNNMINAIGAGIGAGGSILIARQIGRKDYERARAMASTVFVFVMILAAMTCAIVLPLARPLLSIFVSEQSIEVGLGYFRLSVVTSAIIMVNTVYLGTEKAKGSTAFMTILNMAVVVAKIVLNVIFIYGLKIEDMTFVSLATLLANAALFLFVLYRIFFSKRYVFHFAPKLIDFKPKTLGRITAISFPIIVGKMIFNFGKIIILSLCRSFGDNVAGALGVSNNMGGSVTQPIASIEDSTSSIISTNLGAGKVKRAEQTFFVGLIYAVGLALVGILIVTIFDYQITHYFAQKAGKGIEDPILAQQAIDAYANLISRCFFFEKLGIFTLAINSAVLGLIYGFGYTRFSLILNISRVFLFRIPSFLVCRYFIFADQIAAAGSDQGKLDYIGAECAGISMGFSNIMIGLVAIASATVILIHINKRIKAKEQSKMLNESERKQIESFIDSYLKNFKHYKSEKKDWCYEDGVILKGAYSLYLVTKEEKYLDFCIRYFDENIHEDGTLNNYTIADHNIDNLQAGTTLFLVNKIHPVEKYQKALDLLVSQLKEQPRCQNGSYWHKDRYPNQVWLDGLYMGQPLSALLAVKEDDKERRDDIVRQFVSLRTTNWDPEQKVYMHCYDETKSMQWASPVHGRSPHVWLRSVGWLVMASADVIDIFQGALWKKEAKAIVPVLKEAIDSLLPYQDKESKMWKDLPLIDDPKNYLEVSGSVMYAYAMLKGYREGVLPVEYQKMGIEVFEGIVHHSLKDGHLNDIVKVSGLDAQKRDGSKEYYLSEEVVADDAKGVGPFMMAYAEYLSMPL